MGRRKIDMATYPRRAHFDYFRSLAYPYFGVTVDVDVTELKNACREKNVSFYLAFMHAAALAADGVPQLRQRIRDGEIVEYDSCPTSHVELLSDETYRYCTLRHTMPAAEYFAAAERARKTCLEGGAFEEDEDAESMYFISSLPWLSYTSFTQPTAGGDDSNPRITWGRYREENGRLVMPLTILVHHALADGLHASKFYKNVDEETAALAAEIRKL